MEGEGCSTAMEGTDYDFPMPMDEIDYRSTPIREENSEHVYCVDNLDGSQRNGTRHNEDGPNAVSPEKKRDPSKACMMIIATITILSLILSIITMVILFQTRSINQVNVPQMQRRAPEMPTDSQYLPKTKVNNSSKNGIETEISVLIDGLSDQISNLNATFGKMEGMVLGQAFRLKHVEAKMEELQKMHALTTSLMTRLQQSADDQNATEQHVSAMENRLISLISNIGVNVSSLRNQVNDMKDSLDQTKAKTRDFETSVKYTKQQLRTELHITKQEFKADVHNIYETVNKVTASIREEMKNETVKLSSKFMQITSSYGRNLVLIQSEMREIKDNLTARIDQATAAYSNISEMMRQNGIDRKPATPVRLVGGATWSGRVEIWHEGEWGTICDDGWDLKDAHVICRMLGSLSAIAAPPRSFYGEGDSKMNIWLDSVQCQGTEARISDCRNNGWGVHNCNHAEDASVVCRPV